MQPFTSPAVVDSLGSDRLNYLRGDRRKEIKPSTPLEEGVARFAAWYEEYYNVDGKAGSSASQA